MGGCSVVGCRNRFTRGKLHFYRFPKDFRRDVWIQFTRKGNNFQPKGSSTICEVHFTKDCFLEKKNRIHLSKDAVPTIFFKQSAIGLEMIQIPYDGDNHQYFGQESIELLRGKISVEDEEAIANKRHQKLLELKSLCRFCLCPDLKDDNKCVAISKLDAYQIDLGNLLTSLELAAQSKEIFGDLVCEQCFQQIVEIDLFKKKCREAQDEVFAEIQELEAKIQEIRSTKSVGKEWYKNEVGLAAEDSQMATSTIEILEEHLIDDGEFDEANFEYDTQMEQSAPKEEYIEEIHDGFKIIYQQVPDAIEQVDFKEIPVNEIISDEACQSIDIQVMETEDFKEGVGDGTILQGVDEYTVASADDIIKNPERNRFCFRIYECFFCKMVKFQCI